MTRGVHHLYVETRDWNASLAFWKGLGFLLDEGWARDDGVTTDGPRRPSGWGPDLLDVIDPDGRVLTVPESGG